MHPHAVIIFYVGELAVRLSPLGVFLVVLLCMGRSLTIYTRGRDK